MLFGDKKSVRSRSGLAPAQESECHFALDAGENESLREIPMSSSWIKVRTNLHEDPRVVALAGALGIDELHAMGMLVRTWAWADAHTIDGTNIPISEAFLDRLVRRDGFATALRKIGWLQGSDGSLTFPRFGEHNGTTAKGRALDQRYKQARRSVPASQFAGRRASDSCPDQTRTETGPDQIREEIKEGEAGDAGRDMSGLLPGQETPAPPGSVVRWTPELGWQGICDEDKRRWAIAYPACDIPRELAQMDVWLRANPESARKKLWPRFITNWLKRGQDHAAECQHGAPRHGKAPKAGSGPVPWQRPTAKVDHMAGF